ncbi:MAG: CPBP family intramembrane glutamic endopeptidase [Microcoleaceae cyanobacterium]
MFDYLSKVISYPTPVRMATFVLVLLAIWLPFAIPIYLLNPDPNLTSILTLVLLYSEFIVLIQFWGKRVYQQPNLLRYYGLKFDRQSFKSLSRGLVFGVSSIFLLFGLTSILGGLIWQMPTEKFWRILGEGLLVALGLGFAEELLFRGWLFNELSRDYSFQMSLWISSLIYAGLHFIKPFAEIQRTWPEFPGLVLLGLIFVWGKYIVWSPEDQQESRLLTFNPFNPNPLNPNSLTRNSGNLSFPIGLHAGLIWGYYSVNVGNLIDYTENMPEWITGIDQNPLAGGMGLLSLGAIARWVKRRSRI